MEIKESVVTHQGPVNIERVAQELQVSLVFVFLQQLCAVGHEVRIAAERSVQSGIIDTNDPRYAYDFLGELVEISFRFDNC